MPGKQTGANISKVAARYTYHRRMSFVLPLFVSEEIIKLLRKPPCYIDGIGRSEKSFFCDVLICESGFDHVLAIIKASFNFQGMNIFTRCSQLFFLHGTNFP